MDDCRKLLGSHGTLDQLAKNGCPPGDKSLLPLRDRFCDYLLAEKHLRPGLPLT